jgi:hypothetical protein
MSFKSSLFNWIGIALLLTVVLAPKTEGAAKTLGKKPYLGWSSWSLEATRYPGYGGQAWLTAEHIKQQSDAMAAKLQKHGYTYINVDSGWRGGWDSFGRPTPDARKFPKGIHNLANYVHAKGQKLGIYYIPGIDDDLLALNPPIKGTSFHVRDIVYIPRKIANGWGGGNAIDYSKPGAHEYIRSIADLFASWKVDFLKLDGVTPGSDHYDLTIDARPDVAAWFEALEKTGRPIWLTLSWAIDLRYNTFWRQHSNAIRIGRDVESYDEKLTHWPQVQLRFDHATRYAMTAGFGKGWNDLDSLLVGNGEMSDLTPDERRSAMTLWAIACSPLYVGDDLTKLDALGLKLLTNDEVIAVQQSGNVAYSINSDNPEQIWVAHNARGSVTLGLFNLSNVETRTVTVRWENIGMSAPARVRDLWDHRDLGTFDRRYEVALAPHACQLLKLTPISRNPSLQKHPGSIKKNRSEKRLEKTLPKPVWIRPNAASSRPLWGIEGGIQFSLWPIPIDGTSDGGPRGLIRVGNPVLDGGKRAGLVNYIAVEPEVQNQPKGYSELEKSVTDDRPGKPMWASDKPGDPPDAGTLTHPDPRHLEVEELSVTVHMEKFVNGAHPYLKLSIRSDRPDELRIQTFHESDSRGIERCILTATMGNFARTRLLHLKGETIDSRRLYSDYTGNDFAKDTFYNLDRLSRNRHGDVVVPFTTDELAPEQVQPFPNDPRVWKWRGVKVTQCWKKEAEEVKSDLQVRVNARRVYWMSQQPIPGGIAFENVEFREIYRPGSVSIFGITRRSPKEVLE